MLQLVAVCWQYDLILLFTHQNPIILLIVSSFDMSRCHCDISMCWWLFLHVNQYFPPKFPLFSDWLFRHPCEFSVLGSSIALGFHYCLDHVCNLCQNPFKLVSVTKILLYVFLWHSRCNICILELIFISQIKLHVVYRSSGDQEHHTGSYLMQTGLIETLKHRPTHIDAYFKYFGA